jgi:SAM-dependent methyltransferase
MERIANWAPYDAPFVRRRYNRIASYFVVFEWLLRLPPGIRNKSVNRMEVRPGDSVLEVGCGTGRNLAALVRAVGPEGRVYGVDVSDGMLQRAQTLCARRGWPQVTLIRADAATLTLPESVNGAIFSLSYAVIPDHREALRRVWTQLAADGSVVIMDAKLPQGLIGRLLRPLVVWASRLTVLGNPDVRPWDELKELSDDVSCEEWQAGTYYIVRAKKRPGA